MKSRLLALAIPGLALAMSCAQVDDHQQGDDPAFTEKQSSGRSLPAMTVALTFDDGPGPRTTELSAYLKQQGIHAGFFMMGKNAKGKDAVMQQVNADGHVIGNHTWDHPLLTKLSSADVTSEIQRTDDVIGPFLKGNMRMFRAPFGGWSPAIADHLNTTGLKPYVGSIFWDIGGELTATHAADWACWGQHVSIDDCANRYIQEIHDRGNHGVVLIHDIHSNSVDMVKIIVPKLKAQGFKFARIDQVPDIHAQLVANGAQPEVDLQGPAVTHASECDADGVFCGQLVGKDAKALFSCHDHTLRPACQCAGACEVAASGSSCDCAAGEPGAPTAGMPTQVGQCADSTISMIGGRLDGDTTFDSGTSVAFANDGGQVSYEKVNEIIQSQVGDPVEVCLVELPKDCPPGDDRGKVYKTTNKRTGQSWTLADSEHMCGGA